MLFSGKSGNSKQVAAGLSSRGEEEGCDPLDEQLWVSRRSVRPCNPGIGKKVSCACAAVEYKAHNGGVVVPRWLPFRVGKRPKSGDMPNCPHNDARTFRSRGDLSRVPGR